MNVARLAVFGVALLAALGAGLLALSLAASEPPEPIIVSVPAEPVIPLAEVLVVGRDLGIGDPVGEALAWAKWPQEGISENLILRATRPDAIADFSDSVARSSFFAGEPVREGKLVQAGRGFMSAILESGKRAVAVRIASDTSAGGFVLPNDHVDIIMTRQIEDRYETDTIMQNVRVLAIDQTIEEQNGERVVVGSTATLEVDPVQAEALTVAQAMTDRLVLSLRSIADSMPGGAGYARFLLEQEQAPERTRVRLVRYGQTVDIETGN